MSTYLVVLNKTVPAQSLRYGLLDLVSQHKPSQIVLLQVPQRRPGESGEEAMRAAHNNVASTHSLLSAMGLPVVDAIVGDCLPKKAIAAEMTCGKRTYDAIVLTSKASGLVRFLNFAHAQQLARKFRVPVFGIEPDRPQSTVAA